MNNYLYPQVKMPQKIAVSFDYIVSTLKLFTSLEIYVYLKDDLNQVIDTRVLLLQGEDYLNWSNDDNYVVRWIKANL